MNATAFWAFIALIVWPALSVFIGLHLSGYVLVIWQVYAGLPLDDEGERRLHIVDMVCERIYKSPTQCARVCMHCGEITKIGLYNRRFEPVDCDECGYPLCWQVNLEHADAVLEYMRCRDLFFDWRAMRRVSLENGNWTIERAEVEPDMVLDPRDDPDFQEMKRELAIVVEQNALLQADDPAFNRVEFDRACAAHDAAHDRFVERTRLFAERRGTMPEPGSHVVATASFDDDESDPPTPEPPRL